MSTTTTTAMLTIKLVVIGASGVGKTSLRGQYISGRFSSGYRATIGADFIAKTLPHPTNSEKTVTLQIWDTAGQERFSSLSTAFFRGADAVILVFDAHNIDTLDALKKWWAEYCAGAPLAEEDLLEHPCFVVGNKIDLMEGDDDEERVSHEQIQEFLSELIPSQDLPSVTTVNSSPIQVQKPSSIAIEIRPSPPNPNDNKLHPRGHPLSPSRSSRKFDSVSSMNTTNSIYFTPSSSFFTDPFHTARSSPEPPATTTSASTPILRTAPIVRPSRLRTVSTGSASSGSAVTMTPSLFAREQQESATTTRNSSNETTLTTPEEEDIFDLPLDDTNDVSNNNFATSGSGGPPPPPEIGPSLHFTSAKTGEGVKELFKHIAARVVRKMEYEEYFEARRMHYRDASGAETIRLGKDDRMHVKGLGRIKVQCCA